MLLTWLWQKVAFGLRCFTQALVVWAMLIAFVAGVLACCAILTVTPMFCALVLGALWEDALLLFGWALPHAWEGPMPSVIGGGTCVAAPFLWCGFVWKNRFYRSADCVRVGWGKVILAHALHAINVIVVSAIGAWFAVCIVGIFVCLYGATGMLCVIAARGVYALLGQWAVTLPDASSPPLRIVLAAVGLLVLHPLLWYALVRAEAAEGAAERPASRFPLLPPRRGRRGSCGRCPAQDEGGVSDAAFFVLGIQISPYVASCEHCIFQSPETHSGA